MDLVWLLQVVHAVGVLNLENGVAADSLFALARTAARGELAGLPLAEEEQLGLALGQRGGGRGWRGLLADALGG